ncbi:MBG domain-containing protein [Pedobacter gandavensis]|uniref:MBG domain-containing protein n=1 Tax=Pedobacter gandavensis TaxID=2679963 RepID=UPI002930C3CB|nr:MBG domain-containing protein [Pedobacter gandavensis]
MKTSYLQKLTLVITFCLFFFSAKTSRAQLLAGDLAIIGVNAKTLLNPVPTATISFVALAEIPSGTIVNLTDIGYTGSGFVTTPIPPGITSPDGTATWTVTTKVPAGTVFTITILAGISPSVSILPNAYGNVALATDSWTHAIAEPIPINAGDTWLLYTGTKASPNFMYGFSNAKNPDLDQIDETTGWTKDGQPPKNQSSTLPATLKAANAYTSLISFKTVDNQRDFNAYSGTFFGSKSTLLAQIKNTTSWTATDNTADAKVLTPGTTGGAFPGTQPIYKLGSSVLSVTATPSTGIQGINASIVVTVNFSDVVSVTGTPRISLNTGGFANYTGGTGGKALTFNYTVAPGESNAHLDYSSIAALELNGGTILDSQNDPAQRTLPAIASPLSLAGSSTLAIDGVVPIVSFAGSSTANGSYGLGQNIDIVLTFPENVTVTGTPTLALNNGGIATYFSGSGSPILTFRYTIGANQNTAHLEYAAANALALAGGTIKDAALNDATLTLKAPGLPGSLGSNNSFIIDTTIPTVVSVTGTNGNYGIGSIVPITITFSENIIVTGNPELALNAGMPAAKAIYASGTGTPNLTFNYTIAEGQASPDLEYMGTGSLTLAGGTLKDAAKNNALLTLPVPGLLNSLANTSAIVVNTTRPRVMSILRKSPSNSITNADAVEYTVIFSEAVNGVDVSDFESTGSIPGAVISSVAGSGSVYIVGVSTATVNGNMSINLKSSGTGIVNAFLNPINTGFGPSDIYTIDKTAPTLTAISIRSNSAAGTSLAKAGDIITINFRTSETINTPVVNINGNTATVLNTAGNDWVATYITKASDNDGLVPFSFTYSDLAGNTGIPRGTTTDFTNVFFDKTAPTLPFVSIVANNASYPAYAKAGALVTLSFRASESITTPIVTIGGATVTASPAGGFNWVALYTLPSGLADGVVPFTINYTDTYGNTGAQQISVNTGSMVTLDKTIPTLSNVSISSNNPNPALAKPGDQVTLTFTASEGIQSPGVFFYGSASMSIVPQGNNVWTAIGVLSALNTEGAVPFEIRYSDFAGNAGTAVTTTNDASTVRYDKTLPVPPNFLGVTPGNQQNTMTWFLDSDYAKYELIGGATGALGNNVLTTITAANATNPMSFTQTGLTNFQTYYYALRVTDAAGNINTSSTFSGIPLNAQTITFDQPVAAEYGSSFTLNATSTSGLPVTFTSNEPALATISGNTVTIIGVTSQKSVSIIATQPGNANYSYAPPVVRLLEIKPKPVTVTATAQTKVFGGLDPAIAAPTISPALFGTDVSTGTLARASGENAGNYEIGVGTFTLDPLKYAITYVPANFSISQKTVTINPFVNTKVFNQNDPTLSFMIDVPGVPVTGALKRTAGENVGSYGYDLSGMTVGSNFQLALNPTPKFNITPLTIEVTATAASKQYGDTDPSLAYTNVPALKIGDNFSGSLTRAPGETPGNYAVSKGTLALSTNYLLNFNPATVNFTVLKKDINITPTAGQGKVYGELDGNINYVASPALLNGDTFSGALGRAAGSAVADYPISIGSLVARNPQNYNLQLSPENYAITRKPIMVIATAVSQVYGDADPLSLPYTLSVPLATGDSFSGKLARTPGSAVGSYPVNQGNLALGSNYDLDFTTADLTITKKAIAITAVSKAKNYGENDPAFEYNFSPLVSPDVITGTLTRTPGENAGTYNFELGTLNAGSNYTLNLSPLPQFTINNATITVTPIAASIQYGDTEPVIGYNFTPALKSGDVFTGALARAAGNTPNSYLINQGTLALSSNYTLNFSAAPVNFVVLKKNISITPAAGQGKVYGEIDGTINYTSNPALLNGDTFSGALARSTGSAVADYPISIGSLVASNAGNYNLQLSPENYAITKRSITLTATPVTQVYGIADPATLPYTLSDALPNGDVVSGSLVRAPGSDVGTYAIAKGNISLGSNYDFSFSPANLTITQKPVAVTAANKNKTYGDTDPEFTYTSAPALIGSDKFSGSLGRAAGDDIGKYALTLGDLALSNNYLLTLNPGAELQITKKTIQVTAEAKSKVYGTADPVLTYLLNPALVATDTFSGSLSRQPGSHVGSYVIGQGDLTLSTNYQLNYTPANLDITAKAIAVQLTAAGKTYGATDPALAYTTIPALESGDTFSGSPTRAPGENKGTYLITKGILSAGPDYTLNFTNANFVIDPAPLTLTADDQSRFVGLPNPVLTGKYAGFVNGQDASVLTSQAVYNTVATVASPIGTYPIVPSGAAGLNYTIKFVNGVLTLKAAAPTSVLLAAKTVYENQSSGTSAGTLSSISDDPQATFTYSLVTGNGDTDNAAFQISGDQLLTAASLDYENKKVYSVLVRSTTQHGFFLDQAFKINLNDVNEIPTLNAIANATICYTTTSQAIDLTGITAGPENGQHISIKVSSSNAALLQNLTVTPDMLSGSSAGKAVINYRIKSGASGVSTITVTVKDDGGTDNGGVDTYSKTFVLTVNALPVVSIAADKGTDNNPNSTTVSKGETVVLTASGGSSYAWAVSNSAVGSLNAASLTVRPRETTTYTVTVSNANGCTEQKSFTVTVLDDLEKIKATNILSPNGDGYNDKWIIDNIDFYPNNEVKIFDKSGRMVYSKKGYDNTWDGMLNGSPLTEGTYFYVIDFGKDRQRFKGFITIVREN